MQEFEITAPDGRIVTVTGDKMPTAADLDQIFAALPKEEKPQEKRSYLSGVGNAAMNAYFMGLGDELKAGGQAIGQVGPRKFDWTNSLPDAIQNQLDWKEQFDKAYDPALEKERALQDEFVHDHPVSAFVAGVGGGALNPLSRAVPVPEGTLLGYHTLAKSAAMGLSGAGFGGLYGFNEGRGGLENRLKSAGRGAAFGGAMGAAIPFVQEGWRYGKEGIKNVISGVKKGIEKTPFVGGALGRSADDIKLGAQDISGRMPDNGEITGQAVKNLADDVMSTVKTKSSTMYDKVNQMSAGKPVVLDKNSSFAKAFNEVAKNSTKSGRAELNKIWEEVGHSKYDAPTYETAKTFRSMLSRASKNANAQLDGSKYGKLIEALDKDIDKAIGKEAFALKKMADAAYRNEAANPDSVTGSVERILGRSGNRSVSEVGSRAISSAQGDAWKSSALKRLIEEGEKIGSPHVAGVKQGLQANTTTRAQFNRMAPDQKIMVYGDKLAAAEKNFNGGALNFAEKVALKTVDKIDKPIQRVLNALRPVPIVSGYSTVQNTIK